MTMDVMRSGYESHMKLWRDQQTVVRGRWIRMPDDTPFLPSPHHFGSRKTYMREVPYTTGDLGETGYVTWTNGENEYAYPGDHHCGSSEAAKDGGRTGVDPPIQTDAEGRAECCELPEITCGVIISGSLEWTFASPAGCPCIDGYSIVLHRREDLEPDGYIWWMSDPPFEYVHPFGSCLFGKPFTQAWFRAQLQVGTCQWTGEVYVKSPPPFAADYEIEAFPVHQGGIEIDLAADSMISAQWGLIFGGFVINESDCQVKLGDATKRMLWRIQGV